MNIKILGSGCSNCSLLQKNVELALEEINVTATLDKVTDFADIAKYNCMKTPGLVINETLVSFGKVNEVSELVSLINNYV